MNRLLAFVSLASLGYATPLINPSRTGTTSRTRLESRATSTDPSDLSSISSWAALGDSYAAGIGAGKPLDTILHPDAWFCSRWDQSYPYVMHQGDLAAAKEFKYLACSGWTSTQIREEQVPKLDDKSQQLITLSSGGNDVYLSELLDACVYRITPQAAITDKCASVMDRTADAIEKELFGWLDDLYTALEAKLTDDGKIYVTGYAQFWNSNTDQCDKVTWKMWGGVDLQPVNLTKDNRKRMNQLAIGVNNKIKEVIQKNHAKRIVFVDIDPYVTILQGRFCEPSIVEPDANRPGLLFYNRGTVDDLFGDEDEWSRMELKRAPEDVPKDSFEGSIAAKFEETMRQHPDWRMTAGVFKVSVEDIHNATVDRPHIAGVADMVSSFLPDTFKRIFHPRPFLHSLMAQLIVWHIQNERADALGLGRAPQRAGHLEPENASCKLKQRSRDLVCRKGDWRVPKEKTTDGSTSVRDAIKQFCKNRNGALAEKGTNHEHIYDRWDISGWGVTKRQSLWLRASSGPFSQCPKGTLEEKDCVAVLTGGLQKCDQNSDYTFGYQAQGDNCMEYSVETSASVHEGDPPWAEHVKKYPPPETLMADLYVASGKHKIDCFTNRGSKWNWDDANAAIDQYCNNDLKYGGLLGNFRVQKNGISIGAYVDWTIKNTPYKNPSWCTGFDNKHKNSDDCKYAFRKILGSRMEDHITCFTHYRCVGYWVEVMDFTKDNAKIYQVEDGRRLDMRKDVVHQADVSGWNATANSTSLEWYSTVMTQASSSTSNSSIFVSDL